MRISNSIVLSVDMAFPSKEQLHDFLSPLLAQFGVVAENIAVAKAGAKSAVKIAVDSAEPTKPSPDLDSIEEISRAISQEFDQAEEAGTLNFGPGYTLEVSTPGVDFPLTQPRHWVKNSGRQVKLPDGRVARIAQVVTAGSDGSDDVILVAQKKKQLEVFRVELAEVAGAVVEVEFSPAPPEQAKLVGLDPADYADHLTDQG